MRRVLALVAFACALAAQAEIRVRDDVGSDVTLRSPARRIVSLAPHATELLYAAGAGAQIVGVVRGSDHPAQARELPVVGDVHALDLERIVALRPDLVVTWPYTTPAQVATLKRRGIAVFTTDAATIDGIAADIERLGALAGTEAVAAGAAARFRMRLAEATAASDRGRRVRVFYQIWDRPLYSVGGTHLISQALEACGGLNVFGTLSVPAPQVSIEAVLAARPEVIVAGTDGSVRPQWLDAWRRWPALPAVASNQLHVVDADELHRPGPRFADGVARLCEALASARR